MHQDIWFMKVFVCVTAKISPSPFELIKNLKAMSEKKKKKKESELCHGDQRL